MMPVCLYCTCMGQLASRLPVEALRERLAAQTGGMELIAVDRLCDRDTCRQALSRVDVSNGIVVAACSATARGLEALSAVREDCPRAALADIREGCVWVGATEADLCEQAADLVAMSAAGLLSASGCAVPPRDEQEACQALVIGAGPAGLAASAVLTDFGIHTTLAERRNTAGGMLNQIGLLFPRLEKVETLLAPLARITETLDVQLGTSVTALRPEGRRFVATLRKGTESFEQTVDVVVFATGGQPVLPGERYRAREVKGVISQMELETLLTAVENGVKTPDQLPASAVCIQCTAAREDEAPYCSAVCCPTSIKNALRLKTLRPEAQVTILHRNIVMPGIELEQLYRKAMQAGVRFLIFDAAMPPEVVGEGTVESVLVRDTLSGKDVRLDAERVVCSTPLRPTPSTVALARGLNLRLDTMQFVCGHEPMQPLETDMDGVYVCGSARWPAYAAQAVEQGRSAGLRAVQYMRGMRSRMWEGSVSAEGPASTNQAACSGCGRCVEACPYGACTLESAPDGHGKKMTVLAERCRRCGSCVAVCPCGAVTLDSGMTPLREAVRVAAQGAQALQERLASAGEGRNHG